MCRLFETIKVENGKLFNLEFHNERLNRTRKELFNDRTVIDLKQRIEIPPQAQNTLFKCRVVYKEEIEKVEWEEYRFRNIERLKIVHHNEIEYHYKFYDRRIFDKLKQETKCSENEEILIIKNSFVTDTSYTNIIFNDGERWITPNTPLLKGVEREKLLKEKKILEHEIKIEQIKNYKSVKLINVFNDFESAPELPTECIVDQNQQSYLL